MIPFSDFGGNIGGTGLLRSIFFSFTADQRGGKAGENYFSRCGMDQRGWRDQTGEKPFLFMF